MVHIHIKVFGSREDKGRNPTDWNGKISAVVVELEKE